VFTPFTALLSAVNPSDEAKSQMHLTQQTYETACREIERLCHKELHQGGLDESEKARFDRLADAVGQYEEDPSMFYKAKPPARVRDSIVAMRAD
jgi:hypothetical protein